jgi:hypothetical protein
MKTLNDLLMTFGKEKLNTLTKYPSILTLHKLGDKGRLTDEMNLPEMVNGPLIATEKIDGTNARILLYGGDYIVGSRENLLHARGDRFWDPAQGIVDGLRGYLLDCMADAPHSPLMVIYGEFYGGKVTAASKNYGTSKTGFRVFDVAIFPDALKKLAMDRDDISRWREMEGPSGMVYGQRFLSDEELDSVCRNLRLERVPVLEPFAKELLYTHDGVLAALNARLKFTEAALTEDAQLRPEGVVLRTVDRKVILKARIEDYERALKRKS